MSVITTNLSEWEAVSIIFKSKRDLRFNLMTLVIIGLSASIFVVPAIKMYMNHEVTTGLLLTVIFGLLLTVGCGWICLNIRYTLREKHLTIKAGFIKTDIPYDEIHKLAKTKQYLSGFRVLSSFDGIDVIHKHGEVKISPANKQLFIDELLKRCTNLKLENL